MVVLLITGANGALAQTVEDWGYNGQGQLGNGTSTDSSVPVSVIGLGNGATGISAGGFQSLAIVNGAAHAWGEADDGQLGSGTRLDSQKPLAVSGFGSGVTMVAGGAYHSLGVLNGGAYAWGDNLDGELGNGTTGGFGATIPVAVSGLSSGVTAVAGGYYDSLAVQNGAAYSWGDNFDGQLGNGTSTNTSTPMAVSGLGSGVSAVAAGANYFSLAIKNGAAYAWGNNGGQLGDGTTTNRSTPVGILGLTSGVTAIAAGFNHGLALKNGNVYAWGGNSYGQLGNGTTTGAITPIEVDPTDLKNIVAIAAGDECSFALSTDGSLWVWGLNGYYGQLGLGANAAFSYATPQQLLAPSGYVFTAISASASGDHAMAILSAVPESSTWTLLVAGAAFLGEKRRRLGTVRNGGGGANFIV